MSTFEIDLPMTVEVDYTITADGYPATKWEPGCGPEYTFTVMLQGRDITALLSSRQEEFIRDKILDDYYDL